MSALPPYIIKDKTPQEIKVIGMVIGGYYLVMGVPMLGMSLFQKFIRNLTHVGRSNPFENSITQLYDVMLMFAPFLILLGACYLVFGLMSPKISSGKSTIGIVLAVLSFLWACGYAYTCYDYMHVFFRSAGGPARKGGSEEIARVMDILIPICMLPMFALYTVPQWLLVKKILKLEKNQAQQSGGNQV